MPAKFGHGADEPLFFVRYWRGDGCLRKIFWLYGVLASLAVAGIYVAARYTGDTVDTKHISNLMVAQVEVKY